MRVVRCHLLFDGTEPEMSMPLPSRRTFLQTALAAAASVFLPKFLLTEKRPRSFWFLHTGSGEAWAVDDPVAWSLENARTPILKRARERLVTLDAADPQRVIRLVVRRCRLNLLELRPGRVAVHHWGQQGQGDLRPFFKQHGLATKRVRVVLLDRKREVSTPRHGDDSLFGERLPLFWPWKVYWRKWQRRAVQESDDWSAAPHTWSGFPCIFSSISTHLSAHFFFHWLPPASAGRGSLFILPFGRGIGTPVPWTGGCLPSEPCASGRGRSGSPLLCSRQRSRRALLGASPACRRRWP